MYLPIVPDISFQTAAETCCTVWTRRDLHLNTPNTDLESPNTLVALLLWETTL